MNKYNAEHYWDETAAIAISRAGKARRRVRKEPIRRLVGLTYRIGEIARLVWIDGRLVDTMKYRLPNAERNTQMLEGIAAGNCLLPA